MFEGTINQKNSCYKFQLIIILLCLLHDSYSVEVFTVIPDENNTLLFINNTSSNVTNNNITEIIKDNNNITQENDNNSVNSIAIWLLQFIGCIYTFLGICITCHCYLFPALDRICKASKLSEDLVGATILAAGSSAPELATVLFGTFVTKDDMEISDVIGSAVFNMMFVPALCGLLSKTALFLDWWSLCRNCGFYAISVICALIVIWDGKIFWYESIFLLVMYAVYCCVLYHNQFLEALVHTFPLPASLMRNTNVVETKTAETDLKTEKTPNYSSTSDTKDLSYQLKQENVEVPGDEDDKFDSYKWFVTRPIHLACRMTMPNYEEWYASTFVISLIWIAIYSYVLVGLITLIGHSMNIPNTVTGLTLVAAAASMPDAVISISVALKGNGNMALSNAVGSNIFDIHICLGLPWLLKTLVSTTQGYIDVYNAGHIYSYSTFSLLSVIVLLVGLSHWNSWKLNKIFGTVLMAGYVVFVLAVSLYQLLGYYST